MSIPWWAWIVVILLIVLLLFYGSIKSYRRQLRTAFLEYLGREHPDLEAREISSREIGITAADGEEGTLFLHRLYREGASLDTEDKEAQRELFARFATVILEGQGALEVDPERDAKRIFPRIVPASFPEQAAAQVGTSALPALSLGPPGLVVVLVLDSEQSVAYLSDEQLADLGVSVEEALERAKENLSESFSGDVVRTVLEGESMSVVKSLDSYDAARLLLVSDHLGDGESVVALIPDRDTLVLGLPPEDGDWSSLRKLAKNAAGEPLWREPLLVTREGISTVPE